MTSGARSTRRAATAVAAALLSATYAGSASAEAIPRGSDSGLPASRLVSGFAALDRPVGIAEGNVGVLTLPGAEVCAQRSAGCKDGDLSFALEAWEIYRANLKLAFGAGVVLGLIPVAHPRQNPEAVQRDHTRSYLTIEGVVRYYPYVGETVEVWVAPVGGLVVVNDRYQVTDENDERALLGTRGVTIRTEGASLGVGIGFAYELRRHWSLIGSLRLGQWLLPNVPATDPLGSEASLTGRNTVYSLSFGIAYRLPL